MEIQVVGGLAVRIGAAGLSLGTPKQQLVLALLVVRANQLVPMHDLVDELWPDDPPRSAIANVRTYAGNLRRSLDSYADDRLRIVREPGGYRLLADESLIDLYRLTARWRHARELMRAGAPAQAVPLLEDVGAAVAPLLAGLTLGPVLTARREAASQERRAALESLAEAHLILGRPESAASLLREEVSRQPLWERAQCLLMRALTAAGDAGGALAVYRAAREALTGELGVPPSEEMEQLRVAAALARRRVPNSVTEAETIRKRSRTHDWLPRTVPDFVGRKEIVDRLLHDVRERSGGVPTIRLIDGMAGCGKTTLALHVASRLAERFPDGQLFVDLRGHTEDTRMTPTAALDILLRQMGVPAGRIPMELPDRLEMWRRELATRAAMVVLDNAADSRQVEPLLPTSGPAVVLVTSRRRLLALTERPPVSLAVLSEPEALQLLTTLVGDGRVTAEREAARRLVGICGCLPLAVRLAGTRLAHRPDWRISDLVDRLNDRSMILPGLRTEARSVIEAFAESYEPLDEACRRTFRSFGLVTGGHLDTAMVAALNDLPWREAADVLDELVDRNLVQETAAGRYRLHDLMRRYAAELAREEDERPARHAAVQNLLDHLLHSVVRASAQTEDSGVLALHLRLGEPRRADLLVGREHGDLDWLEDQRLNLIAFARQAAEEGHEPMAWRLARASWRFFYTRGYFDDISVTHSAGLAAARRCGDRHAVALMHNYLASACVRTGAFQDASTHLHEVVSILTGLGDAAGAQRARFNLGVVYWLTGRLQQSLEINRLTLRSNVLDTLPVLPNLGLTLRCLGRYDESMAVHRLHLFVARTRQDPFHMSNALGHLGGVRYRLGQNAQAERLLRASLALRDRTGSGFARAETISDLAGTYRQLGRYEEALRHHEAAIEAAAASGEQQVQAEARNELAVTLRAVGRGGEAAAVLEEALAIATRIAHPYEQARALSGLAEHLVDEQPVEARRYRQRALAIFERMGAPERHELRRQLAAMPSPPT
ncbi:transcriptional regulator [Micromonospora chalcea]|uniref:Transcriptional regulator n=2 Tax=Micromonospora chalcea TaxID=1874 RepID=A0ABX9YAH0_MICCH|nr:transcriptional regulator [Micromonospora sp. II]RQW95640.1 transcriptional regulator [Micromonospora chalcea]RQX54128.1 transcriptional regulator [Micromonospora chalcea]